MQKQLTIIKGERSKDKSARMMQTTTDKLQYLMKLNQNISLAMAETMENLSDIALKLWPNLHLPEEMPT